MQQLHCFNHWITTLAMSTTAKVFSVTHIHLKLINKYISPEKSATYFGKGRVIFICSTVICIQLTHVKTCATTPQYITYYYGKILILMAFKKS